MQDELETLYYIVISEYGIDEYDCCRFAINGAVDLLGITDEPITICKVLEDMTVKTVSTFNKSKEL